MLCNPSNGIILIDPVIAMPLQAGLVLITIEKRVKKNANWLDFGNAAKG
jgi:hypothetical protein